MQRTLMIWSKLQQSSPVYSAKVKGSARYALKKYGYSAAEIARIITDLDCGRAVNIKENRIELR
jgi:hypothetical protein